MSPTASIARRFVHFFVWGSMIALASACSAPNNGNDGSAGDAQHDGLAIDGTGNNDGVGMDVPGIDTMGMDIQPTDGPPVSDGPIQFRDGITVTDDSGTHICYPVTCAGHSLECGDCVDNDHDGLTDDRDPECLGPCDNTESAALVAGVGGETGGPCAADCYFDFGNGPGNDDCHWNHHCDPHEVAPNYYPEGASCSYDVSRIGSTDCPATQSTQCHDFCTPLTPNGCDCFGCCTFPGLEHAGPGGTTGYVWLGSLDSSSNPSCTLAQITDPAACHPCLPVGDCLNECGHCEVCIGRPVPPPDCYPPPPVDAGPDAAPVDVQPIPDGGTTMQCPAGVQPCGLPGQADCSFGWYCITGCCQMAPG